jgi:hypothetical protein
MIPDTSKWPNLGRTSNTTYFKIDEGLLGALPDQGSKDTGESAQQNVDFQNQYFRSNGQGVVIVFIDTMVSQDGDARGIYQSKPDPEVFLGVALVGGTRLSRAMGSFFLGLAKPNVPFKFFREGEQAFIWGRTLLPSRPVG